mmetsp:Transcript_37568/g.83973  ORF Transcript_37568/g.83973 Transcript_37568/m.83973 type:complete len:218 (-) Transcript_37568:6-659(-)
MVAAPSATSDGAQATVQRTSSGEGAAQVKTAEKTARPGTDKAEAPGAKPGEDRVQVMGAGAGASPSADKALVRSAEASAKPGADKNAETTAAPHTTSGEFLTKLSDTFTVGGAGGIASLGTGKFRARGAAEGARPGEDAAGARDAARVRNPWWGKRWWRPWSLAAGAETLVAPPATSGVSNLFGRCRGASAVGVRGTSGPRFRSCLRDRGPSSRGRQ